MRLAAVPKLRLLPTLEIARGIPHAAAREVQRRLLAGMGQRGDRILVQHLLVDTPLGDNSRARHTLRLVGCMVLHNSSDTGVKKAGGATAHGAVR